MNPLTPEELEAETIYKILVLQLIDKDVFIYMASHLDNRNKTAGDYLIWLVCKGIKFKFILPLRFLIPI